MTDLSGHLSAVDKASLFDAFEQATTGVGLAVFVVHVDASPPTVIYASQLLAQLVGRPVAELVGRPPWALVAPVEQARVRETISRRGPGAPPITMEVKIERPNGAQREIEVGIARITTSGAELAVGYFRDTTETQEAVAALRRSEERFRSLIDIAPDGVVILQQGRIMLANPPAVRMLGAPHFEAVRNRLLAEFLPEQEAARAAERIARLHAGETVPSSEYQILAENRVVEVHSAVCEYNGKPATLSFVRDATERRRMQEQLFRNDRLAALGTMAAAVGHEINNPLTYLQLNLQRLEREAATESNPARATVLRDNIANALHGVERIARIVRDLRAYSRADVDEPPMPVDVVAVVEGALRMVDHDLRHRARLVRRYANEPAVIDGSAGRLEQVMINLLVNAIHALDDSSSMTSQITIDIEVGDHVKIIVGDTGPGISEPERAFDPFFTTKPAGEGTGLGLSVCKQLVESMGGRIEIASTGPQGTQLAVVLPRRKAPWPKQAPEPEPVQGERLRVLVIDDELHVRSAMKTLLGSEHDVEIAGDGEAALAMIGAADYDVILCDLMMPRMNGREVYDHVRAHWPGVESRIVFITGGAFVPSLASFLESIDNLKLRKPFKAEQALALVREASRRANAATTRRESAR